jgi:hypothetical protein
MRLKMIDVNSLIQNAFQRTGICMDGEVPTPTQAMAGVADLQSLITELNGEDYLLENYETYDAYVAKKIKFAVKPDTWYEVANVDIIDSKITNGQTEVGDVYKIKDKNEFYTIRYNSDTQSLYKDTNAEYNAYMTEHWPTFCVDAVPDRCIGVARKVGNTYKQLIPADKMMIDAQVKGHLAELYTIETEWVDVDYLHDEEDPNYKPTTVEYFVIEFDSNVSANFRITILKGIKIYKAEDKLQISSKYQSMIEDGLCVKLCQRYKYLEMKEDFEKDFEWDKELIKRVNSSNRPMLYQGYGNNDYNRNYWDLTSGRLWG